VLGRTAYLSEDTIAAISTEVGGAICVVRLSGTQAFAILERVTQNPNSAKTEERKLVRAQLYGPEQSPLDDALFVRFVNPQSYTGEDLVEFHVHGGGFIAHRLMESLLQLGARQALPGEFSFRAVRNGKMNLFQAQAVVDLIAASNENAVSLALEKLGGSQNHLLQSLSSSLRKIAVMGEVGIDFADQDIEEVSLPALRKQVLSTQETLTRLRDTYSRGMCLQEGIRVAFVGLPNAGKSSFFNALLGEDRSIVSEHAGTTRDVIREKLVLRGQRQTITLRLEDTAGLRTTENPIEKIGIQRTVSSSREADLILFIVDPHTPFEAVVEQWDQLKNNSNIPLGDKTLGILTKSDLISENQAQAQIPLLQKLGISQWAITSAQNGSGMTQSVNTIVEFCEKWTRRDKGELLLTRLDHFKAVQAALEHLVRAQQASEIDLFASDIRQSLYSLGPLIGETLPDDILGQIFSDFCIGK
jgi:tRNA modification GTPase